MDGPAWGDVGNVVPLRRDYSPQQAESRAHARGMSDAVRSFDRLERCAAALRSGPLGTAREVDGMGWPIVSFQVELPGGSPLARPAGKHQCSQLAGPALGAQARRRPLGRRAQAERRQPEPVPQAARHGNAGRALGGRYTTACGCVVRTARANSRTVPRGALCAVEGYRRWIFPGLREGDRLGP